MSNDDEFLRLVAVRARALRADDAALEAVARGELAQEAITLTDEWSGEERIALSEACLPFGQAYVDTLVARVRKESSAGARRHVVSGLVRTVKRPPAVIVSLALAAAIALVTATSLRERDDALPEVTLRIRSQNSWRSEAPSDDPRAIQLASPLARFEVLLRPEKAVPTPIRARAYLVLSDRRVVPAVESVTIDVSADGAVRLRGDGSALDQAVALRVVLGRVRGWSDADAFDCARTDPCSVRSARMVHIDINR
jgi:hypothetical protein